MGIWQRRSKRKASGGLLKNYRKKRKFELGSEPTRTTIGEKKLKKVKGRGGSIKLKLRASEEANVLDPKTKKIIKSKILGVVENPANPHFIREKIITKGSVIKTEIGDVKVTSRPGQDGQINAILIKQTFEKSLNKNDEKPKKPKAVKKEPEKKGLFGKKKK